MKDQDILAALNKIFAHDDRSWLLQYKSRDAWLGFIKQALHEIQAIDKELERELEEDLEKLPSFLANLIYNFVEDDAPFIDYILKFPYELFPKDSENIYSFQYIKYLDRFPNSAELQKLKLQILEKEYAKKDYWRSTFYKGLEDADNPDALEFLKTISNYDKVKNCPPHVKNSIKIELLLIGLFKLTSKLKQEGEFLKSAQKLFDMVKSWSPKFAVKNVEEELRELTSEDLETIKKITQEIEELLPKADRDISSPICNSICFAFEFYNAKTNEEKTAALIKYVKKSEPFALMIFFKFRNGERSDLSELNAAVFQDLQATNLLEIDPSVFLTKAAFAGLRSDSLYLAAHEFHQTYLKTKNEFDKKRFTYFLAQAINYFFSPELLTSEMLQLYADAIDLKSANQQEIYALALISEFNELAKLKFANHLESTGNFVDAQRVYKSLCHKPVARFRLKICDKNLPALLPDELFDLDEAQINAGLLDRYLDKLNGCDVTNFVKLEIINALMELAKTVEEKRPQDDEIKATIQKIVASRNEIIKPTKSVLLRLMVDYSLDKKPDLNLLKNLYLNNPQYFEKYLPSPNEDRICALSLEKKIDIFLQMLQERQNIFVNFFINIRSCDNEKDPLLKAVHLNKIAQAFYKSIAAYLESHGDVRASYYERLSCDKSGTQKSVGDAFQYALSNSELFPFSDIHDEESAMIYSKLIKMDKPPSLGSALIRKNTPPICKDLLHSLRFLNALSSPDLNPPTLKEVESQMALTKLYLCVIQISPSQISEEMYPIYSKISGFISGSNLRLIELDGDLARYSEDEMKHLLLESFYLNLHRKFEFFDLIPTKLKTAYFEENIKSDNFNLCDAAQFFTSPPPQDDMKLAWRGNPEAQFSMSQHHLDLAINLQSEMKEIADKESQEYRKKAEEFYVEKNRWIFYLQLATYNNHEEAKYSYARGLERSYKNYRDEKQQAEAENDDFAINEHKDPFKDLEKAFLLYHKNQGCKDREKSRKRIEEVLSTYKAFNYRKLDDNFDLDFLITVATSNSIFLAYAIFVLQQISELTEEQKARKSDLEKVQNLPSKVILATLQYEYRKDKSSSTIQSFFSKEQEFNEDHLIAAAEDIITNEHLSIETKIHLFNVLVAKDLVKEKQLYFFSLIEAKVKKEAKFTKNMITFLLADHAESLSSIWEKNEVGEYKSKDINEDQLAKLIEKAAEDGDLIEIAGLINSIPNEALKRKSLKKLLEKTQDEQLKEKIINECPLPEKAKPPTPERSLEAAEVLAAEAADPKLPTAQDEEASEVNDDNSKEPKKKRTRQDRKKEKERQQSLQRAESASAAAHEEVAQPANHHQRAATPPQQEAKPQQDATVTPPPPAESAAAAHKEVAQPIADHCQSAISYLQKSTKLFQNSDLKDAYLYGSAVYAPLFNITKPIGDIDLLIIMPDLGNINGLRQLFIEIFNTENIAELKFYRSPLTKEYSAEITLKEDETGLALPLNIIIKNKAYFHDKTAVNSWVTSVSSPFMQIKKDEKRVSEPQISYPANLLEESGLSEKEVEKMITEDREFISNGKNPGLLDKGEFSIEKYQKRVLCFEMFGLKSVTLDNFTAPAPIIPPGMPNRAPEALRHARRLTGPNGPTKGFQASLQRS